jgi:hypothetical protein
MSAKVEWTVRCEDFSKTFQTKAAAERWLACVVEFGHCRHEHIVEEWTEIGSARRSSSWNGRKMDIR